MTIFLVTGIALILFFLVMFYRRSDFIWGVGLLAISSAVLLGVTRVVFNLDGSSAMTGLWLQLISGLIISGIALWFLGVLRPWMGEGFFPAGTDNRPSQSAVKPDGEQLLSRRAVGMSNSASEYDRQLLFDQIKQNLGLEDVLDLMFDVEMAENEVIAPTNDMTQTIHNMIDLALERDQISDLALAVERILTPVPPDHFPRLARITVETPSTILRRYLLTFYDLDMLQEIAGALDIDWELMGIGSKQQKVRNLLLWIRRRNRMGELIEAMHARPVVSGNV